MNAKQQIKNLLREVYAEGDVNAMEIFKGFAVDNGQVGWQYRKFGRSEYHCMGKSVAEAKEYVEDMKTWRME
jgi:hypothetical protein